MIQGWNNWQNPNQGFNQQNNQGGFGNQGFNNQGNQGGFKPRPPIPFSTKSAT